MIRIDVEAEAPVSAQARRYAEYRVFAGLVQLAQRVKVQVRHARVVLRPMRRAGACDGVECAITLTVGDTAFRVRATGDHPYDAINRAGDRLSPSRLVKAGVEV